MGIQQRPVLLLLNADMLKSFNIYLFAYDLTHSFLKITHYWIVIHGIINMIFHFQKKKN